MSKKESPIHKRALLLQDISKTDLSQNTRMMISKIMNKTAEVKREKLAEKIDKFVETLTEEELVKKLKEM